MQTAAQLLEQSVQTVAGYLFEDADAAEQSALRGHMLCVRAHGPTPAVNWIVGQAAAKARELRDMASIMRAGLTASGAARCRFLGAMGCDVQRTMTPAMFDGYIAMELDVPQSGIAAAKASGY